jgi:hypothetical protein
MTLREIMKVLEDTNQNVRMSARENLSYIYYSQKINFIRLAGGGGVMLVILKY